MLRLIFAMPKILLPLSFLFLALVGMTLYAKSESAGPIQLQYTATNGQAIDLSKMRGKVVLLDFWATWCPPCRAEVPEVVETYNKFHGKGFEVLGVSLDQDKGAMISFTKDNGMVWPQYFDGKGWDNDVSQRFGVDMIPAMWLIGKDGKVITTQAGGDLAEQVSAALQAP